MIFFAACLLWYGTPLIPRNWDIEWVSLALPAGLLSRVDVLVPNRTELALLAGAEPPATVEEAAALARSLTGPRGVVVTLGAEGALVVEEGTAYHVPALPANAVDATAAGDTFCGALVDGLLEGKSTRQAVEWAVRAAALTTERPGAMVSIPTRAEVEERFEPGAAVV